MPTHPSALVEPLPPSRRSLPVLIAALVALVAAACGAGPSVQTSHQVTGGSEARLGAIAVRDAMFSYNGPVGDGTAYRPGETVSVQATIVNEGTAPDQLVSVSSPIAGGGVVLGSGMITGRHTLTAGYTNPIVATTLPDTTSIDLRLTGLKSTIRAGLTYPVVFTFARAGAVRLALRVEDSDEPSPECPLPPNGRAPQVLTAPLGRAPAPPTPAPPDCSSLR